MDKKRSVINVTVSILSHILLFLIALAVRRFFIQYIGNEANGLNSLYGNIIGMLGVVELGIGRAIMYSMYKPIISGDHRHVAALYGLYKRIYRIIGAVILTAGLAVTPFLRWFINDYESLSIDTEIPYLLTLVSVTLSYLYSAKTALIEAHKDNYVTTGIVTVSRLVRYGTQILTILLFRSFTVFLCCQIGETLIIWLLTEWIVRRKYKDIIERKEAIDGDTKREISRNVKAMFLHKAGTVMVKTADSLIISGFIGVVILGKYSNYNHLAETLAGVIVLFFSPLTSIVGHLCAGGDSKAKEKWFAHLYTLNFILGFIFFLGYYAVADGAVELLFGNGLAMSKEIAFIITVNQFTQYMRNTLLLFRNASGTFYYDRWKPMAEGMVNLALSLLFVIVFPEQLKVAGVIVATIITTFSICYTVEPYVVFHHVFQSSPKRFYIRHYLYTGLFCICLPIVSRVKDLNGNDIKGMIASGCLSLAISVTVIILLSIVDKDFRKEILIWVNGARSGIKRIRFNDTLMKAHHSADSVSRNDQNNNSMKQ